MLSYFMLLVWNMLADDRIIFLDFHLTGHVGLVPGGCVKMTGLRG